MAKPHNYPRSKECVWDGVTYPSIAEAARQLGITRQGMQQRLSRGLKGDRDIYAVRGRKPHPVTVDGVTYPSKRAAMKALRCDYYKMLRLSNSETNNHETKHEKTS